MSTLKRKNFMGRGPKEKYKANENRFKILQSNDCDDTFSEDDEQLKEYKVIIPPIVVDALHSFQAVYKLLGTEYQFKRISVGTKIISPSLSHLESAKKKLIESLYTFYTHESKDTKLFNLVLYGLPQTDPNEIKQELKAAYNIKVVNIKEILTARSSKDDALYMLEFDRTQNSKSQVLKIRRLCSIVVFWRKPLKSNKGPTQCSKCAMYGHGSKNCFRKNICIACGGDHDAAACQVNKTPCDGPAVYKCFNCIKKNLKNTSHRADDPRCPSRKDYLLIRENIRNKARPTQNSWTRQLIETSEDFPHMNAINSLADGHNTSLPRLSYAEALKSSKRQNNTCDELYSTDQLFSIFTEALVDLRNCKTKIEQINVIMTMLKYAV